LAGFVGTDNFKSFLQTRPRIL